LFEKWGEAQLQAIGQISQRLNVQLLFKTPS